MLSRGITVCAIMGIENLPVSEIFHSRNFLIPVTFTVLFMIHDISLTIAIDATF